jgi:hypothetical protein
VGVEPANDQAATADGDCSYGECRCSGAANALQGRRADCPAPASLDGDLQRLLAAWDGLPLRIRKTVLALVGFGDLAANG